MKMKFIVTTGLTFLFIVSAAFFAARAADELWQTDFEAAKAKAKADKKLLLVSFTGSDWCIWCKKLKAEVFDQEVFEKEAAKHFVLVEADIPHDKTLIDEELLAHNKKLAKKYDVYGFPKVLILDADGQVMAETGYQEGGPEKYLEFLVNLTDTWDAVRKCRAELENAKGFDRVELLSRIVEGCEKLRYKTDDLPALLKEIAALDPKNKSGWKTKFEFRFKINEIDELMRKKDFAGVEAGIDSASKMKDLKSWQTGMLKDWKERCETVVEALKNYERLAPHLEKSKGLERAKVLDQMLTAFEKLGPYESLAVPAPDVKAWIQEIITLEAAAERAKEKD
jgi:thioredoxin-related protein